MTPLVFTHAFAALTALLLGGAQLLAPKGGLRHRVVGRVWVAAMLYVAVTSFWITDLRPGEFSFLHVLSVVTVVTVSLGVWNARRGSVEHHLGNMVGSYVGLLFAFGFAVAIPSRHVPTFVVTDPPQAVLAALSVVLTTVLVLAIAGWLQRRGIAPRAS